MNTNAQRPTAVLASVALIAAAFGLGYFLAGPRAPLHGDAAVAAVRAALAHQNELERTAALAPILASLEAGDLDAVVREYEATFTSTGPGTVAMELLSEAWSKIDPAGALERIAGWREYRRSTLLPFLMRSWARRDAPAARAALDTIEPVQVRETATTAMILGWAESGAPGVWEAYVAGLPFGRAASYDLMRVVAAREGVDALLQRALSVPEDAPDRFRSMALQNAVEIATRIDPERAAAFAEQHREDAGGLEPIVAMRWATTDGPRAIEWALSRPAGRARDRALRAAFEYWAWSPDRIAALDWARQQPDEVLAGVRDLYALALGKTDPQQGLEISVAIADPASRSHTQSVLAGSWLAQQPDAAAAWLEEHGLGDLVVKNPHSATPPRGDGKAE